MSFFPLLTMGYIFGKAGHGILKGSADSILRAWYHRPTCLQVDSSKNPQDYSFIQDLDIGETTGQFRRLYRRPAYRRYVERINEAGVPLAAITDRPAKNILEEISSDALYRNNRVVITNGGACVYELGNPTAANAEDRYQRVRDLKLSVGSVNALRHVIEGVSTNGGARNMPLGAFVVNTDESRNIYVPDGTSLFARMRISFGLKRRNIISNDSYDAVKSEARNISFEIFPKFSHDFMVKRTSLQHLVNWGKKESETGAASDREFIDRFLKSRFIRYIGRYSPTYEPADPRVPNNSRYMNLPKLRNFFWRHKNTYVDGLNQIDLARSTLLSLISARGAGGSLPPYFMDTCVTFSTKGLEFVPAGASKTLAIEKMAELRCGPRPRIIPGPGGYTPAEKAALQAWDKDYTDYMRKCMISGDNYSDFMRPVPIKELNAEYEKWVGAGKDPAKFECSVDILDVFMALSTTPPGLSFSDIREMGIRYNVTANSCSSSLLDLKHGDEVAKEKIMMETVEGVKKVPDIEKSIQERNDAITKLDDDLLNHRICGITYKRLKAEQEKLISDLEDEKKKIYTDQKNKFKAHKASFRDSTRYNREDADDWEKNANNNKASTGRELENQVQRIMNREI